MIRVALILFAFGMFAPCAARAGDLTVRVVSVQSDKGHIRAALCDEARFLKEGCPYQAVVPAEQGLTIVVFHDIPPGRYAVQMFHDENDNEKFDRSFIGLPNEGVGFSRDAPLLLSPRFGDAAIDVPKEGANILVTMRYSVL